LPTRHHSGYNFLGILNGIFGIACVGVGHPEEALPDVRRTEARSAEIETCKGVRRSFQASLYIVEPVKAVFACNLLAKDNVRLALRYKTEPCGEEVALIVFSCF
jgi:hypothetical protein